MIIYQAQTGKFVREMADADNVPMSTKLALPTAQLEENQYYSFRDENDQVPYWPTTESKWVVKTEFEKCTAYNIDTQEQKEFDDASLIDDDYTLDKPPSSYHTWSENGWELTAENEQKQLSDTRSQYVSSIDSEAARIYNIWTRFESEYVVREAAANEYKNANYEGDASSFITSVATSMNISLIDATELILQQSQLLRASQEQLAAQRMRKYELNAQTTLDAMRTTYDDIIANMQTIEQTQRAQS